MLIFLLKFDPKLEFHGVSIAQLDAKTLVIEKQIDVKGLPDLETHWGGSLIVDGKHLYIYGIPSVKVMRYQPKPMGIELASLLPLGCH